MGKKNETNIEEDDQFSLEDQISPQQVNKTVNKKSMKSIYQELLAKKGQTDKVKEEVTHKKKIKKEQKKTKKQQLKHQNTTNNQRDKKNLKLKIKQDKKGQNIQKENEKEQKMKSSFKFIKNKSLQDQLRKKTLNGVLKILNLISTHQNNQLEA